MCIYCSDISFYSQHYKLLTVSWTFISCKRLAALNFNSASFQVESNVFYHNLFCLALIRNELLKTAQSELYLSAQWGGTGQTGCAELPWTPESKLETWSLALSWQRTKQQPLNQQAEETRRVVGVRAVSETQTRHAALPRLVSNSCGICRTRFWWQI